MIALAFFYAKLALVCSFFSYEFKKQLKLKKCQYNFQTFVIKTPRRAGGGRGTTPLFFCFIFPASKHDQRFQGYRLLARGVLGQVRVSRELDCLIP